MNTGVEEVRARVSEPMGSPIAAHTPERMLGLSCSFPFEVVRFI